MGRSCLSAHEELVIGRRAGRIASFPGDRRRKSVFGAQA